MVASPGLQHEAHFAQNAEREIDFSVRWLNRCYTLSRKWLIQFLHYCCLAQHTTSKYPYRIYSDILLFHHYHQRSKSFGCIRKWRQSSFTEIADGQLCTITFSLMARNCFALRIQMTESWCLRQSPLQIFCKRQRTFFTFLILWDRFRTAMKKRYKHFIIIKRKDRRKTNE